MLRCAVVEDEKESRLLFRDYVSRFNREKGVLLLPLFYRDAEEFLSSAASVDLVLMDIRMPGMSGMDAARILRERDDRVQIVFITSLASYALQGYEVGALDYIIKPVAYPDFALKIMRALKRLPETRATVRISGRGRISRVCADEIVYLEAAGHEVIYHTVSGDIIRRAALSVCEAELPDYFCRTNNCYVVNLLLAERFDGNDITVGGDTLRVSEPRRSLVRKRFDEIWKE